AATELGRRPCPRPGSGTPGRQVPADVSALRPAAPAGARRLPGRHAPSPPVPRQPVRLGNPGLSPAASGAPARPPAPALAARGPARGPRRPPRASVRLVPRARTQAARGRPALRPPTGDVQTDAPLGPRPPP